MSNATDSCLEHNIHKFVLSDVICDMNVVAFQQHTCDFIFIKVFVPLQLFTIALEHFM